MRTPTRRPGVAIGVLLLAGLLLRVALTASTDGDVFGQPSYDLESFRLVGGWLHGDTFGVYGLAHDPPAERWPYPPGFFGPLFLLDALATPLGVALATLVRIALGLGDLGLALLAWTWLRRRTGSEERALAGAAVVLFGPSFFAVSSVHGQLDALAWLPALAGVALWHLRGEDGARRALACGLLIGLGAAIKTVPGIMVLALLPTCRTRREAATLIGAAVAVPGLLLLPFLAGTPGAVTGALGYRGVPGAGGLSLLLPELAGGRTADVLKDVNGVLAAGSLLAATALLVRRRTDAPTAALTIVVTLWVLGANFTMPYAVWGLAVLVMCGWLWQAVLLQALLALPLAMTYAEVLLGERTVYVASMAIVYAATVIGLALLLVGGRRAPVAAPPAPSPR